jgi:hypothetical protein
MKKILLTAAIVFTVNFASAQSADFKNDVINYIKLSGATSQVTAVIEPIMDQLPEDKKADFRKDFDATLPSLYEKMATVMMKYYNHEDIKKMIEFYNSPVGKKIQETTPKITKDQMEAGQEWGLQLQGLLMKYMQ